jgi:hypothetical protein
VGLKERLRFLESPPHAPIGKKYKEFVCNCDNKKEQTNEAEKKDGASFCLIWELKCLAAPQSSYICFLLLLLLGSGHCIVRGASPSHEL